MVTLKRALARLGLLQALACSAQGARTPPLPVKAEPPVVAAPPPKDDGSASEQGAGGAAHASALEQLRLAPLLPITDRQRSVRFLLPDARRWTRVKFFGIPTLMGLRYGKDHHAVVGVTVQHVPPGAPPSACAPAFEAWGAPWLDVFDVDVKREDARVFPWAGPRGSASEASVPREAELHASYAKAESLAIRDGFAVAYATYPAWSGACLIVGIAVPARDDEARAIAVRDRFAREVLPSVVVVAPAEPTGRE